MTDKIKIYVSCHKECFMPQGELFYPIQVGAAAAGKRFAGILHDDEGDNISHKNPTYCELTAQYWAWKNDDADYYGFFHYRRYMSFSEKKLRANLFEDVEMDYLDGSVYETLGLQKQRMVNLINRYDVIATTAVNLKRLHPSLVSNYYQYASTPYQYKEDLDVMMQIIKEKYPAMYDTAVYYMHQAPAGYFCNMFIMKKEIFHAYSAWLFDILQEHERRRDYRNYDAEGYRVSGYLGERLFGIYYTWLKQGGKVRCRELQRTLFRYADKKERFKPAFAEHNIAIALAANDYFVPYLAATLASVAAHADDGKNYDILVLSGDIRPENRKRLAQVTAGRKNFSIRYLNPAPLLSGYHFYMKGHFSIETYYRLVLPELLPDYDKVLYLDSDLVVEEDVARLYEEDVKGYLLAAARDADTAGLYNGFEPDKKRYTDKVLRLKRPYDYFQAGVVLFHLEAFRKAYTTEKILRFAAKRKWQLLDQDVLNKLCEGRVKYVDMSWNVMVDYNGIRISQIIRLAPQWLNRMYIQARKHPKVIHYAGPQKPWIYPEMDFGERFWKYAKETPFYEMMLYRMGCAAGEREARRAHVRYIRRGIQCVRENGLVYTLKYIPKRLAR